MQVFLEFPRAWASHCSDSSCCRALPLLSAPALVVAAVRLRNTDSVAVMHGLSCSAACGIFPDQGSNLQLLHWQADSMAEPPGKSQADVSVRPSPPGLRGGEQGCQHGCLCHASSSPCSPSFTRWKGQAVTPPTGQGFPVIPGGLCSIKPGTSGSYFVDDRLKGVKNISV